MRRPLVPQLFNLAFIIFQIEITMLGVMRKTSLMKNIFATENFYQEYKLKLFNVLLFLYCVKIGYLIINDFSLIVLITKNRVSVVSFQRELFLVLNLLQLFFLIGLFLRLKLAWILLPILTSFFFGTLSRGMYDLLKLPNLAFSQYLFLNQLVTIYWFISMIVLLLHFHRKVVKYLEISDRVKFLTISLTVVSFFIGLRIIVD